ncbi:MAG: hypothetical protein LH474_12615 [Chamaesiphon sp.]|nr:hypothetical protein [Chamaesiphon sp.]
MTTTKVRIESLQAKSISTIKYYKLDAIAPPDEAYLRHTEERMLQLNKHHIISQSYVLPIPYICQIYHLLNLKHLESVHNFSLKGLKIGSIGQLKKTATGGSLKFDTTLNPTLNILKIWRQHVVEVELTLHTPYTIELNIPVYNGRNIAIIFNVLPLGNNAHKLFIDIYSAILFPKPILQILLHCACCLTLFEDLPYLNTLAQSNINHIVRYRKISENKTMQLFKHFIDLYGC